MERLKILAVDDNAVNLAAVEQTLQEEYEIVPMLNGRRALKYLKIYKVDLILLDIQMPEMDGVETLGELRKLENGAKVPVIFLTALQSHEAVLEEPDPMVMDYITKPFDKADLRKRVADVLQDVNK